MNKVFKVIWSEARNAYVVVSEIAKNHGSKSCSTKKLLTMLIATGVMTCASMAPAMAGNPAPDDANKGWTLSIEGKVATEIAPGATVDFSGKKDAGGNQNIIVRNDGNNVKIELQSELNNVSAIVNGASRVALSTGIAGIPNGQAQLAILGDSITLSKGVQGSVQIHGVAAGTADTDAVNFSQLNKAVAGVAKTEDVAVVYDKNKTSLRSTNATGVEENAIALGKGAYAVANSIAIGNGAYTQDGGWTPGQSVALGNGAVTGAKSTSIGSNAVGGREGTITIGANANNGSVYATVIGTDSKLVYATKYSGAAATIVGANSEIKNDQKFYSGVANGIFGSANTIKNSNGVTIQGSGNTVTNAYKDMSGYDFYLGGVFVKKDAGAVGVIGGMNTVSDQIYTNVIGFGNTVAGDAANISHDVFVAGSRNNLSKVSDSIVMGNDNEISDRSNVISLGHENNITANNAVAIGNGAGVSAEGGVALGVGSVASTAAGVLGYGADGKTDATWQATKGAVSVGGNGVTRQITNVAAGKADTDAVNVAQLKKVSETAANANKGWKLSTGKGEVVNVAPDATVDFSGDDNIKVSNTDKDVKVELEKDLTGIESISNGGVKLALNGAAGVAGLINGKGASVFLMNDSTVINGVVGIDKNGKITNVAADTADTDAVNYGQLKDVKAEAGKHTTLSNGKNTTVTSTNKDGQIDYQVNVAGDLTDITSVANGASKINLNEDSISISNGSKSFAITNSGIGMSYITAYSTKSIMLGENGTTISGGLNVAGSKITGVAKGEADTDAVNVGQLKEAVEAGNTDTHIKPGEYGVGADNTVNMDVVDKNGKKVDTVTIKDVAKASDVGNVNDIANDLKNGEDKTTVVSAVNKLNDKVGDLQYSKVGKGEIADGDSTTTAIGKLDQKLTDVAATAAKHTTVTQGDNITVTKSDKLNENGGENYNVALKKDIKLDSVTTGQTVMNNEGLKVGTDVSLNKDGLNVGDKVSVTGTAVKVGDTTITDKGLEIKDGPSVTKDGINAGNKKVTGVADGDVKENSKDAINGGQLHQAKADINNRIDGVENQVISNSNRINQLGNRVNKVGAGAAALAALHPMDFDPDDKLTFSAGYGNYGGENAAAIGAYYRPDEKVMFSVGGTVGNGENMVNAGVSFALDRTNHVSNSRTAMAREILDLRAEVNELKAMVAKGGLGSIAEDKMKIFPDVAENHWAYEYIGKLAAAGIVEGYPDGNFNGDRMMSRYEFAAMLYRAMQKGAQLDSKIINEFAPEMGRIRVDRISGEDGDRGKIERVRVNAVKGERDHYGNKIAKAEAKAK